MAYIETPALAKTDFFKIKITHLPTSTGVAFRGWVNSFSDEFASSWNETSVYGRMDPLATFQNTRRTISLDFSVVSDNHAMAKQNLSDVNKLIEFLYPVYQQSTGRGVQNTLKAAPLIGLHWTNLVNNADSGGRLVGYMSGLTYAPDMDEGGFIDMPAGTSTDPVVVSTAVTVGDDIRFGGEISNPALFAETVGGTVDQTARTVLTRKRSYIPKRLDIGFSFTVLHTHLTGWYAKEDNTYVFGNANVNGKFPNASYVEYETTVDTTTTTGADGSTTVQQEGEPTTIAVANEALILES
tara:strand:- start:462 stop:1352 length:891 start_codon:yes stop_codon:yes gene_type:complete